MTPAQVGRALAEQQIARALELALDGWRSRRAAAPGAVITWIDSQLSHRIERTTNEGFQHVWTWEAEQEPTPTRVGWLCKSLASQVPLRQGHFDYDAFQRGELSWDRAEQVQREQRIGALFERFAALADVPRDPRVADAVLAIVRGAKHNPRRLYAECAELIASHGDARHLEHMKALIDEPTARSGELRDVVTARLHDAISNLAPHIAEADEDEDEDWLALLPSTWAPSAEDQQSADELLALVYDDPYSDELRHVCADRLQELGDPRGEFIALQLQPTPNRAAKARMKELEALHRDEWLGPALSAVLRHVRFREGFPVLGTLAASHEARREVWDRALADERLATFEKLARGRAPRWLHDQFLEALEAFDEEE